MNVQGWEPCFTTHRMSGLARCKGVFRFREFEAVSIVFNVQFDAKVSRQSLRERGSAPRLRHLNVDGPPLDLPLHVCSRDNWMTELEHGLLPCTHARTSEHFQHALGVDGGLGKLGCAQ